MGNIAMSHPSSRSAALKLSTSSTVLPNTETALSGNRALSTVCKDRRAIPLSSRHEILNPCGKAMVSATSLAQSLPLDATTSAARVARKNTVSSSCQSSTAMSMIFAASEIWERPIPSLSDVGCPLGLSTGAGGWLSLVHLWSFGRSLLARLLTTNWMAEWSSSNTICSWTPALLGHPCRMALLMALSRTMAQTNGSKSTWVSGPAHDTLDRPVPRVRANSPRSAFFNASL